MDSRRSQQTSDESASSTISLNLRAEIDLTNRLSALLDARRNEEVEFHLQLQQNATPHEVLSRVLSLRSTIPTTSSFATFNQVQQIAPVGFRTIGFGQCGIVFERPGRGYVVKVSRPFFEDSLWSDFKAHFAVQQAFKKHCPEVSVPKVFSYIPKTDLDWWGRHLPFFDLQSTVSLPAMALMTERILPLPRVARQALIDTYCPAQLRAVISSHPTNRDCLARVYLGRRRPINHPPPANFSLRNFNLCLDQMVELNLPVRHYAKAIGEALATIHWSANVDAYDVEFVLGSEGETTYKDDISLSLGLTAEDLLRMPSHTNLEAMMSVNRKRRSTRIWVLDYNLCNKWEEEIAYKEPDKLIAQLVLAFFENDPYYPRPSDKDDEIEKELWATFSSEYLDRATQILSAPGKDPRLAETGLPQMFIDNCLASQRDRSTV
jgi:hypothetical protein